MLTCIPFAFTFKLDAGAINKHVERAFRAKIRDCRRQGGREIWYAQCSTISPSQLSTIPVV